jgi:murein DD-endopeptidase MepM/ murein hydrolase activator NlpD
MACLPVFCGAILLAVAAFCAFAQNSAVSLTPAVVQAGSPELIRIDAPDAVAIEGEWLGRKLRFFRGHEGNGWFALAGADVEAPNGPSQLQIKANVAARAAHHTQRDLSQTVEIMPATYRTSELSVAPRFVAPGPKALRRIEAEIRLKDKIFSRSSAKPLWVGNFQAPVTADPMDNFGERRTFNGSLDSIHKGLDFRSPTGTVVQAANSGRVVLARRLYYEGNCVVIDHGLGIFTISMHLSRIAVHEGQRVRAGQRIGRSGATGRVTGPHLHWSVLWQGAYLNPAKLLALDLSAAR